MVGSGCLVGGCSWGVWEAIGGCNLGTGFRNVLCWWLGSAQLMHDTKQLQNNVCSSAAVHPSCVLRWCRVTVGLCVWAYCCSWSLMTDNVQPGKGNMEVVHGVDHVFAWT